MPVAEPVREVERRLRTMKWIGVRGPPWRGARDHLEGQVLAVRQRGCEYNSQPDVAVRLFQRDAPADAEVPTATRPEWAVIHRKRNRRVPRQSQLRRHQIKRQAFESRKTLTVREK